MYGKKKEIIKEINYEEAKERNYLIL